MGRDGQMTPDQQLELGRAVLKGREGQVSWKGLERIYGRSRRQLQRYARQAEGKMSHLSPKMSHLECCEARTDCAAQ